MKTNITTSKLLYVLLKDIYMDLDKIIELEHGVYIPRYIYNNLGSMYIGVYIPTPHKLMEHYIYKPKGVKYD